MIENPHVSTRRGIVTALRELITALDRRAPHGERAGEIGIARDADVLRRAAVAQLESLSSHRHDERPYNHELVDAIMTDDGCPSLVTRRTDPPC